MDEGAGQPLVGRDGALTAIALAAQQAADGHARVVWVEGEGGAGKSTLTRAAVERLDPSFHVIRIEADEVSTAFSYSLLMQLLPAADGNPFAAGLLLLDELAERQGAGPVALVVEDLHWADAASRQALLAATRRLSEDRVLEIVTSRPSLGADDGWERLSRDPQRCTRVALDGFDDAEVTALARRHGVDLAPPEAARLRRHTGGLPLHVETLLNELTPQQLTSPSAELPAPRSLAAATTAAIAALDPAARELAAALAVIGQRTSLRTVARVAGVDHASDALDALVATGFVHWSKSVEDVPIEFAHPLYQAAVYDDLSPAHRRALHLAAAAETSWGPSWAHRVAAADGPNEALAAELERGARYELDRHDPALAATYYLWASGLGARREDDERRLLLGTRLVIMESQFARLRELTPRVLACTETPLRDLVAGMMHYALGEVAEGERLLRNVEALAATTPTERWIRVDALGQLALLCSVQGRGAEAISAAEAALALGPTGEPDGPRHAWYALAIGVGMLEGPPAGLQRLADHLPPDPEEVAGDDAELLVARGILAQMSGRTGAAIADLRAFTDPGRRAPTNQLVRALLSLSRALFATGEWDEALTQARTALSLVLDEGRVWTAGQAEATLALVVAARGDEHLAEQHMAVARQAATTLRTPEIELLVRLVDASLARARDDAAGVVATLAPIARDGAPRPAAAGPMLAWWPPLVTAMIDVGDVAGAAVEGERFATAAAARRLDAAAHLAGLRARLLAAGEDVSTAPAAFAAALELMGPDHPVLDRALLQHAYGRLLLRTRDRRGAMRQLGASHVTLDRLGAEPYRQRVAADLGAAGLNADRRPSTGAPLALTEREQDVVTLVKKGLTNKEVAASLYVSVKAVEYHLGNVYGKLGIRSRRALRDLPV